jgi:hypothetical protein
MRRNGIVDTKQRIGVAAPIAVKAACADVQKCAAFPDHCRAIRLYRSDSGVTSTGQEVIAQALYPASPRLKHPFVALRAAMLSLISGGKATKKSRPSSFTTEETVTNSMFQQRGIHLQPFRYRRWETRNRRVGSIIFSNGEIQSGTSGLEFRLKGGEYNAS